jgi:hypothetical protein
MPISERRDPYADILSWEIDFFHDVREGDRFQVIVKKITREDGLTDIRSFKPWNINPYEEFTADSIMKATTMMRREIHCGKAF